MLLKLYFVFVFCYCSCTSTSTCTYKPCPSMTLSPVHPFHFLSLVLISTNHCRPSTPQSSPKLLTCSWIMYLHTIIPVINLYICTIVTLYPLWIFICFPREQIKFSESELFFSALSEWNLNGMLPDSRYELSLARSGYELPWDWSTWLVEPPQQEKGRNPQSRQAALNWNEWPSISTMHERISAVTEVG